MNREKRDKIPSMQVSFIDAICVQLYEVNRRSDTTAACVSLRHIYSDGCFSVSVVADFGWNVGVLFPVAGRMPEEPTALEALSGGGREGPGQRHDGVIPTTLNQRHETSGN